MLTDDPQPSFQFPHLRCRSVDALQLRFVFLPEPQAFGAQLGQQITQGLACLACVKHALGIAGTLKLAASLDQTAICPSEFVLGRCYLVAPHATVDLVHQLLTQGDDRFHDEQGILRREGPHPDSDDAR